MKEITKAFHYVPSNAWWKNVELELNGFKYSDKRKAVQLEAIVTKDRNTYSKEGVSNKHSKMTIYATNIPKDQMSSLKLDKKIRIEFDKAESIEIYGDFDPVPFITAPVSFYE